MSCSTKLNFLKRLREDGGKRELNQNLFEKESRVDRESKTKIESGSSERVKIVNRDGEVLEINKEEDSSFSLEVSRKFERVNSEKTFSKSSFKEESPQESKSNSLEGREFCLLQRESSSSFERSSKVREPIDSQTPIEQLVDETPNTLFLTKGDLAPAPLETKSNYTQKASTLDGYPTIKFYGNSYTLKKPNSKFLLYDFEYSFGSALGSSLYVIGVNDKQHLSKKSFLAFDSGVVLERGMVASSLEIMNYRCIFTDSLVVELVTSRERIKVAKHYSIRDALRFGLIAFSSDEFNFQKSRYRILDRSYRFNDISLITRVKNHLSTQKRLSSSEALANGVIEVIDG